MAACRGSFRALILFDVADGIDLKALRSILKVEPGQREPSFTRPAPNYVRFERPPLLEPLAPVYLASGHQFQGRVKYYDYGVLSVELEHYFDLDWHELVQLSSALVGAPEIEEIATGIALEHAKRVAPALTKPSVSWLNEDYYIVHLHEAYDFAGRTLDAPSMLDQNGDHIAMIVRGERNLLSDNERQEALRASLSYYPTDLIVIGWVATLVYDTPHDAVAAIQLLEYANSQLLEYRHYDGVLTTVLSRVYRTLERKAGPWSRWRMAREAAELNTLRLDITELAEHTDNAIKFLSDMFYARLYRLAAERVGVGDYRLLVDEKLRTAGELYEFMTNEFHQGRAFVLELLVVFILIIDLVFLFRGK
ncbi:MAG: hypothetical protein ABI693_22365 [Bryobacteraceae bacterium]